MRSPVDLYNVGMSKARLDSRHKWVLILAGLLVCSLGVNLLLARRVSTLKAFVSLLRSEASLAKGDKVPGITARDPQGRTAILDYAGTNLPTVLFVITPTCGWCTKNVMNMRALVENASDRYRFIGLSLESDNLSAYLAENKLEFPVYTDLPFLPIREYKLGGTPQTIVVSPEGEVMKIWAGAFADETLTDVESYFGVRLPGLTDPEKLMTTNASSQ